MLLADTHQFENHYMTEDYYHFLVDTGRRLTFAVLNNILELVGATYIFLIIFQYNKVST